MSRSIEWELWPGAGAGPAWALESEHLRAVVTARGAHLVAVEQWSQGEWVRVSVDYPSMPAPGGWHGATVGRWANRIAGASYRHGGATYALAPNEGRHLLHGGPDGFDRRTWTPIAVTDTHVDLALTSADGDQGFPGEVRATVRFELEGNVIRIAYAATASEPTPLNLTSHGYWNLAGSGDLSDHRLAVAATRYVEVDNELIPVPGPPRSVRGTRFDCQDGVDLADVDAHGGFDHCFVLDDPGESVQAELTHASGRRMRLMTDAPGLQVYTGQHLDSAGRGVALEAQRIPDGPNRPDFGPAVTAEFASTTSLVFDHLGGGHGS